MKKPVTVGFETSTKELEERVRALESALMQIVVHGPIAVSDCVLNPAGVVSTHRKVLDRAIAALAHSPSSHEEQVRRTTLEATAPPAPVAWGSRLAVRERESVIRFLRSIGDNDAANKIKQGDHLK